MKKILVVFALFTALIFVISCGSGSRNDNKSNNTDTDQTANDKDSVDADSENTDTSSDTEATDTNSDSHDADYTSTPQEQNDNDADVDINNDSDNEQGRKQGELYGECYPNKTCNLGLICDVENNICIKDTESSENNDSDSPHEQDENDRDTDIPEQDDGDNDSNTDPDNGDSSTDNDTDTDSGDSLPDNDADTAPADPCLPNPCLDVENSTKECVVFGSIYKCECNPDHYWDGTVCGTVQTQTVNCTGLPNNAEWNTASEIIQTWDSYLGTWVPVATGSYNEIASTNQCRFKCEENYIWSNNSQCLYDMDNDPLMWSSLQEKSYPSNPFIESSACDNVNDGGFSDWRLPTIDELRTLIQNCDNTKTGGSCAITNECLSWDDCITDSCNGCDKDLSGKYSKLGDTTWLYSVSEQPDNEHNYVVDFSNGQINDINNVIGVGIRFYYRCVRNAD